MNQEEFEKLISDKTTDGTEKLLKRFYGKEWTKAIGKTTANKVLNSIAGVIWAHVESPLAALNGNDKEAVDSAVGAIGTLAGGIIGGPIGSIVGKVISKAPGAIIQYFDTSAIEFNVIFTNTSPYHIRFSSDQTDKRYNFSIMNGYLPGNPYAYTYNSAEGVFIPKPIMFRKPGDKVEQGVATTPMMVHQKWAFVSFQLEAVDDNGNVVKNYDIAFKYPGSWSNFPYFENWYVGVWENSGWPRREGGSNSYNGRNVESLDAVDNNGGQQNKFGKRYRPRFGTSGKSTAYWESKTLCVFQFA